MSISRELSKFIEPGGQLEYDNTTSGLSATTVKSAIDELNTLLGGGNVGSQATFNVYEFTATAAQTTFSLSSNHGQGSDITAGAFADGVVYIITSVGTTDFVALYGASSNTVGVTFTATTDPGTGTGTAKVVADYIPGYIKVYLNGVFLSETDYVASDGDNIVLDTGADVGALLSVVVLDSFNTATQLRVLGVDAGAPDNSLVIDSSGNLGVTGSVTADGLTVSGTAGTLATLDRTGSNGVYLALTDNSGSNVFLGNSGGQFQVQTAGVSYSSKLTVESNGDISFYSSDGLSQALFWDASAESLGIGTSSIDGTLHVHTASAGTVTASSQADDLVIENSAEGGMTIITPDDQSARIRFTSPSTTADVGGASIFYRQNINKMSMGTEVAGGILALKSGAGSEAMTLDASGKILIGGLASQTADLLQIETPASGGGHGIQIRRNDSNTDQGVGHIQFGNNTATDLASISAKTDGATDNGALLFNTSVSGGANTERMRIDASGDVGIGVAPEAWTTFNPVLRIKNASTGGGGALAGSGVDNFRMFANTYYDGAYKRLDTGFATQYGQESGAHVWSTAATGAGASAITWSESMRIDASGNLLVGLSSGQDALIHAQAPKTTYTDYATVFAGGLDSHNGEHAISLMTAGNGLAGILGSNLSIDGSSFSQSEVARSSGYISFTNSTLAGKTSTITFGGLTKGTATALPKMTLDGDGGLLVGKISDVNTENGITLRPDGGARFTSAGTGAFVQLAFFRNGSAGEVGSISTTSSATSYVTSSDQRLKENIADADDAGSKIDAIQVRKFDWKVDGSHQDYGMVAQELQPIAPLAVSGDADSEEMMGVDYSKLVPMMLKEIQSLRARINAIESK